MGRQKRVNKWVGECLRKKRLTPHIADIIIEKADTKLEKYYCPHCFGYHLTKKKKNVKIK